jgi:hypothetical protein
MTKRVVTRTHSLIQLALEADLKRSASPVGTKRFAERTLLNVEPGTGSLQLDVARTDHLAPLFGVVGDELSEFGGEDWRGFRGGGAIRKNDSPAQGDRPGGHVGEGRAFVVTMDHLAAPPTRAII